MFNCNAYLTGWSFPQSKRQTKNPLISFAGGRYISPADVNPSVGRGNPFNKLLATQTRQASFFVSCHRTFIFSGNARPESMVALVGQLSGWPVSSNAGISTPISVTTPYERGNSGGDFVTLLLEAAIMATTPTQPHPELPKFTFHFLAVRRADPCAKPHRTSVIAPNEREARQLLARDFVLLFAGRVPAQGVRHG
ncbi:host cell division inhibitor Icd-like protein [Plesiomonas shigelloides]|uniref:host cell division inhibitor Icd-like protein n=1 Tax=Plesiomonas shigelloides TaxID=703 RepID=UPI000E0F4C1C|nr:host cell division inhibitor Icd-like protein [Plesiomonas shigelloides]